MPAGTVLGLLVDSGSRLHLYVDGRDQGVAAGGIPQPCYVLIDLYGQCQQVGLGGSYRVLIGSYRVVMGSYGVVMGCGIVGVWDMGDLTALLCPH